MGKLRKGDWVSTDEEGVYYQIRFVKSNMYWISQDASLNSRYGYDEEDLTKFTKRNKPKPKYQAGVTMYHYRKDKVFDGKVKIIGYKWVEWANSMMYHVQAKGKGFSFWTDEKNLSDKLITNQNKNTMNGIVPEGYKNVSKADIAKEMKKQFPKLAETTLRNVIDAYWDTITKTLKSGKDSFIRINNIGSFKIVSKQYNKIVTKGKKKTTKKATTEKVKFEPSKNFESLVINGKDLRKKRTATKRKKNTSASAAKNTNKNANKGAAKTRTKKN